MDKKQYLLKILDQLEPVWNLAKGLKVLVEQGNLEENIVNMLIDAIQGAIHTTKSDLAKEKLQKGLDALEKMKELEKESIIQDEKDLAELEKMLDNI